MSRAQRCLPMTTHDKKIKSRTTNELRQTRDAVYNPPVSHDERMNERLVGDIYVILAGKVCPQCRVTMCNA